MKFQANPNVVESHCRRKSEGGIGEKRADYCIHSDSARGLGEFQRTEAGLIPSDWQAKRLKEISPKQSVGLVINPSTYFDPAGTVPMLVGSNVSENRIDWGSAKRIRAESNQQLSASRLRASDIVMVRVGDPGVAAVIPSEFDECNCASMMIVRGHHSFDSRWLCHAMNSPLGRMRVASVQYGTAQKQFNIGDAVNFVYAVPPLVEQRAIAEALSDVDGLLGALDALIAKKRAIKQAAMQQLLTGKTRLPGFSGEWGEKKLGDMSEMGSGGTPPTSNRHYYGGGIPWVSISDMTNVGRVIRHTERTLSAAGLANSAARMFPVGTVLYAMYASIGECSVAGVPLCTSQAILGIRPRGGLNATFLYHWLCDQKDRVKGLGQQGTQANLSKALVQSLCIRCPTIEEQEAVASVLDDMDIEIEALECRRDKTRAIKQGMMQQLLTGRVRLIQPLGYSDA